jgi:cysteine-rich secretory family protein
MITRNYFSHNIPPSGYNVFHVLDQKHYCYVIAGENIGWNNYPDDIATQVVHNSFMQSPGHRSNILNRRWDVIGVGAYKGPTGKKMWTVIFADKCGSSKPSSSGGGGSKATPTKSKPAKAAATPRPTPRPTPKPTPVKTMPPPPTDPPGLVLGPGAPFGDLPPDPTPAGPPPGVPARGGSTLRVVDPTPPGLIETIVGGVTGFYLGG